MECNKRRQIRATREHMQYVSATAEISHADLVQKSGDDEVYGAVFDDCT